ncbi:hypothetical protein Droror1_Dr00027591 [Drosera rotundifolia]
MDGVLVEPVKHGASRMKFSVASADSDLRASLVGLKLGFVRKTDSSSSPQGEYLVLNNVNLACAFRMFAGSQLLSFLWCWYCGCWSVAAVHGRWARSTFKIAASYHGKSFDREAKARI